MSYYETECIKIYHSHVTENGYNVSPGGNAPMRGRTGENNPNFGSHRSDETKGKMSLAQSGENHPNFGKHPSDETNGKISFALSGENHPNFGKHPSEETKKRMSDSNSGENNPMFGKTGENSPNFGSHRSDETKKRMSGENHPNFGKTGENSPLFGKKGKNASSKYFGVYKQGKSWMARTGNVYIGCSKDEVEAAKMYDKYVIENNLPNPLNFP